MSAKRRLFLAFATIGLAVLLASGVAVAEIINGTTGDDTIDGTRTGDNIDGRGGNDKISGLGGADNIHGGAGNDYVFGGNEDQTVEAKASNPSNDILNGDGGNDYVVGGFGDDNLDGGTGKDHITDPFLDKQDDNIQAGGGDDTVNVNNATSDNPQGIKDHVDCGGDHDRVLADPADEVASNCEEVVRVKQPTTAQQGPITIQQAGSLPFEGTGPGLFRGTTDLASFALAPGESVSLGPVYTDPLGEGFVEYFTDDAVLFTLRDTAYSFDDPAGELATTEPVDNEVPTRPISLYTNETEDVQFVTLQVESAALFDVYTFGEYTIE